MSPSYYRIRAVLARVLSDSLGDRPRKLSELKKIAGNRPGQEGAGDESIREILGLFNVIPTCCWMEQDLQLSLRPHPPLLAVAARSLTIDDFVARLAPTLMSPKTLEETFVQRESLMEFLRLVFEPGVAEPGSLRLELPTSMRSSRPVRNRDPPRRFFKVGPRTLSADVGLQAPLPLIDALAEYRRNQDRRALLRLPVEERKVLEKLLAGTDDEDAG